MVKERSMKEKIKRFVENGWLDLIGGFVYFGAMLYFVIDRALNKDVIGCFVSVLVLFPWMMLSFNSYKCQKETRELIDDNKNLAKYCLGLLRERARYKELYGELPKEETKEEPHDTDK